MGLTMCEGKFVGRDEIAMVPTPTATASWKPVPHSEIIDAVTDVVKAHRWTILDEQYGLARDGQRMFGMIRINKSSSMEWSRCIGIRNSHDRTIAVGLAAGLTVCCCSNIKPDRTPEDLLFQVMLEFGITLDSKIEETVISGKKVFKVADNFLIACFDDNVTDEVVKAIAKEQPTYAVLRDSCFASDSVAANFEQIFATYSPDTVRRVL